MQKHGLAIHFTVILTVFLIMPNGNFNHYKLKSKYYVNTTFYRTMIVFYSEQCPRYHGQNTSRENKIKQIFNVYVSCFFLFQNSP